MICAATTLVNTEPRVNQSAATFIVTVQEVSLVNCVNVSKMYTSQSMKCCKEVEVHGSATEFTTDHIYGGETATAGSGWRVWSDNKKQFVNVRMWTYCWSIL